MVRQTFEGTWEEINQHAAELAGHRVRLTILDPNPTSRIFPAGTSLADALKNFIGAANSAGPHSDSENVEKLWGEHVLEKHHKREHLE